MFRSKAFVTIIHVFCWLLFLSLPLLFLSQFSGNWQVVNLLSSLNFWIFLGCYLFLFYFNSYYLLPNFFFKKKPGIYFIIVVSLFVAIFFIEPFDKLLWGMPRPSKREVLVEKKTNESFKTSEKRTDSRRFQRRNRIDLIGIFLFVSVMALGMAIEIARRWRETEQRATQAEADKATAELSFLKAQINPHFLFNTLNNIYSLAVTNNHHTAESIMKLSNIMRYVTDDAGLDFVSLESEVACITDYIDLQRLRLGNKVNVDFSIEGQAELKKIAPLILMTFIENVFKYGISNHEQANIKISLNITGNAVSFFCQNTIFVNRKSERTGGIGIVNTQKRLEYLYPQKHTLNINKENDLFTVKLNLEI